MELFSLKEDACLSNLFFPGKFLIIGHVTKMDYYLFSPIAALYMQMINLTSSFLLSCRVTTSLVPSFVALFLSFHLGIRSPFPLSLSSFTP